MTPLEKAARALAEADARGRADLYANNPEIYQRLARAVLMAVREPQEITLNAGWPSFDRAASYRDIARSSWTAMIDAILETES